MSTPRGSIPVSTPPISNCSRSILSAMVTPPSDPRLFSHRFRTNSCGWPPSVPSPWPPAFPFPTSPPTAPTPPSPPPPERPMVARPGPPSSPIVSGRTISPPWAYPCCVVATSIAATGKTPLRPSSIKPPHALSSEILTPLAAISARAIPPTPSSPSPATPAPAFSRPSPSPPCSCRSPPAGLSTTTRLGPPSWFVAHPARRRSRFSANTSPRFIPISPSSTSTPCARTWPA